MVIGAPYTITQDMMDHFKVDVVCHGGRLDVLPDPADGRDPYEVPKKAGKFVMIDSGNDLSTQEIVERIIRNRLDYVARNKSKQAKEAICNAALKQSNGGSLKASEAEELAAILQADK